MKDYKPYVGRARNPMDLALSIAAVICIAVFLIAGYVCVLAPWIRMAAHF